MMTRPTSTSRFLTSFCAAWTAILAINGAPTTSGTPFAVALLQTCLGSDDAPVTPSGHDAVPGAAAQWVLEHLEFPQQWQERLATAAQDDESFNAELSAFFKANPRTKVPAYGIRNGRDTIQQIRAGQLKLGQNAPIAWELPLDWARTDQGANFQNELHSLRFLCDLMDQAERSGERQWLQTVDEVVLDWIAKNPRSNPAVHRAWYEGTVSKRTIALTSLAGRYVVLEPRGGVPLATWLALLHEHASFLTQRKTYQPNGNHGMRQDLALLTMATVFPEFRDAPTWESVALDRLRRLQIETGFSKEGIWREHSPGYHHYVMRMMHQIAEVVAINGHPEGNSLLPALQEQSERYFTHVITPAGTMPPVGDTAEGEVIAALVTGPTARFSATRGAEGNPPPELDGHFPDAGEVVFRDSWGESNRPASQVTYIHMHAAFHSGFGHRHADDLSFVMHSAGRWWILEGGKHAYDRNLVYDYLRSAQAHNSITFNNRALKALDDDPGKDAAFEDSFVSTPAIAAARARTNRFQDDGVSAARTFFFLRQHQTLILLDELQSLQEGSWQSYLHLPPDAVLTSDELAAKVTVPTHPDRRLDVAFEKGKTQSMRIVKGQDEPMLGWYSPKFRVIEPAPVIVVERPRREIITATVIRLVSSDQPPPSEVQTVRGGDDCIVSWKQGDQAISMSVALKGAVRVSLN